MAKNLYLTARATAMKANARGSTAQRIIKNKTPKGRAITLLCIQAGPKRLTAMLAETKNWLTSPEASRD
jgi:hypothetical protein